MMKLMEKLPVVQASDKSAGDAPSDEHEDKAAKQFPLQ